MAKILKNAGFNAENPPSDAESISASFISLRTISDIRFAGTFRAKEPGTYDI
jgi:hypothetical protein